MTFFDLDIDFAKLDDIAKLFELTPKQFEASLRRALERTAGSVRKEISQSKIDISDLRRTTAIRRRVKNLFRVREDSDGVWIGLNSLWASEFTGRPRQDASGVAFRGHHFKGAFLRRLKGSRKNRIFLKREEGLEEQTISIEAEALEFLNSIVPDLDDRVYDHFLKDVRYRQKAADAFLGDAAGKRRKFYRLRD